MRFEEWTENGIQPTGSEVPADTRLIVFNEKNGSQLDDLARF